ncbi:MAG TPA: carboxypeptidase-like regulatory domain-containing protein [Longimicrobium sp.]|nr:carboxypeptidase-like regulatory domain-containing protein [Longimicrobium sp.]
MKRLWMCAALLVAACAHIEAPTGGDEDKVGPQLLTTRPDTFARAPSLRTPAVFVFDEGLSEERLEEAISVSPRTSAVAIDKRGGELRVSLRRGWEPNRIYQVVIDSTVQDRFSNRIQEPIRLVFSTGPEIPETFLSGTVLERQTAQPAKGVRVEAILRPDSLVYATRTDDAGTFAFAQIPAGEYQVRAFSDPNANRALEPFESRDTTVARVAVGAQPSVELSIVAPDTSAPKALEATAADSAIAVRFDDFLDPAQRIAVTQVRLLAPDSTPVRIASVVIGAPTDVPAAAPDTAAAPVAGDTARRGARGAARGPVPSRTITVRVADALRPDAQYTIRVDGVRNLVGLAGGGELRLRTPRATPAAPAAPPAGTTPAPATPARPANPAPARP